MPLEDVSKYIGDSVKLCDKVSGGEFLEQAKGTPTFFNLDQAFPNQALTILIWSDVRKQLETAPEVLFKDKEVCVTSRIELYKEKPQIVLRRREDVRVMNNNNYREKTVGILQAVYMLYTQLELQKDNLHAKYVGKRIANYFIFKNPKLTLMAKTLEQGFDAFLSWLVPLSSEHEKSKTHKDSVKSCLEKNFACYSFFETGSFGNGTGIRHHSDTDYFAVMPTENLYSDSAYNLKKVKEALQTTFWRTEGIAVNTPAVTIPFGNYASETLEVTPCTFSGLVNTPVGSKGSYYIPNYEGGWMKASPQAHNAYVKRENERLNGKLKPLIRLIKAWKFYQNVPINSFYLELRTTKYAETEKTIIYDTDVKRIIKMLLDNSLASIQDPMGISGYVKACTNEVKKEDAMSKLRTAYSRSEKAYEKRETNLDDCFYWWNMFYNNEFPAR